MDKELDDEAMQRLTESMMSLFSQEPSESIDKEQATLLIVDSQEKLFPHVERPREVSQSIQMIVKGFQALDLPIVVIEQNPKSLGSTICPVNKLLPTDTPRYKKMTFSALGDSEVRKYIDNNPSRQWVVVGLEAHIGVRATVMDLCIADEVATVPNDAISSRSIYDYSTAIAEMRSMGASITSVESILFELLGSAEHPAFPAIRDLVKQGILREEEIPSCATL